MAETCQRCGGPAVCEDASGWVEAENGVESCPGMELVRRRELIEGCGVGRRFAGATLAGFAVDGERAATLRRAREAVASYVEDFRPGETDHGLLIHSPGSGTGKTHLACAALLELVRRHGIRGVFRDFTSLAAEIQATFDAGAERTKDAVLRPVLDADLLVLDELGAARPTEWTLDTIYLIVNSRYADGRPSIFTTNCALEDGGGVSGAAGDRRVGAAAGAVPSLASRVGGRIASRLREMCERVSLEGAPDRRGR